MTALRLSIRSTTAVALQQIALETVLFLLLIAWLHIPDANAFEVVASIVVALLIAGVTCAGESAIALRVTHRQVTTRRLLAGAAVVFFAAMLWLAISLGVDHLRENDGLRAGYLNSRFPASMRNVFSYEHLSAWFQWMWSALQWIAAGLLAAAAFACVGCDKPSRGLRAIIRSRGYWVTLLLLVIVGAFVSGALLTWTPGHGLRLELLSVILRMLVVIVLHAAAMALLLQAMAGAVLGTQSLGTDEPAISQPRTADNP